MAGLYLLILLVLFSDFVLSNRMLYGSDTLQAVVYFRSFYVHAVHDGTFPTWSPYLFGGMPYVDAFHSDIFYPFTIMKFLLPLHRSRGWELILHGLLAGMNMYAAARGWRLSRLSATIAGLAYMLAPYLISMVHPGHDGKFYVTAWFPLGFLFLKRIWDHGRTRDMAIFALIVGTIILTPHVQMAYFTLWAYAAYSIYRIVRGWLDTKTLPWAAAFGSLGAVFLAVGISAIQFYPSYFYVKEHSPRAGEGRGYEYAASWSLHPEEAVSEVVPEFAGVASTESNTYWGRNFFKDNSEYGGLIALLLAVYCVFRTRFRDRWFFFGLGLFALFYALGAHTPVFTVFYHVVPNVKQLRAPSMIMFQYVFAISLCAGAAVDSLLQRAPEDRGARSSRLLWYIAGGLGLVTLLISIAPGAMLGVYRALVYSDITPDRVAVLEAHRDTIVLGFWAATLLAVGTAFLTRQLARTAALWALAGLAALILIDTARMNWTFIGTVDLQRYFPDDPVVDFLKAQPQPIRVLPVPGGFRTNYFALNGIAELTGYHGNQLGSYDDFMGGTGQPRMFSRQALDLSAVDYLVFRRGANLQQDPADPGVEKVYDRNNVVVFRNLRALPRARLVNCWELHEPSDSLYSRLFESDFDYRRCALVEAPLPFSSRSDTATPGAAAITGYELEAIMV